MKQTEATKKALFKNNMGKKSKQLSIGDRFGRWTITGEEIGQRSYKQIECTCDCGTKKYVYTSHLRSKSSLSCGCLHYEILSESKRTHGETNTPLFAVWSSILRRCNITKNYSNKRYGGRGISVCSEWRSSYESFRDWANSNGYRVGLQIDRINNDGNYEPSNCRWTTCKQNSRNKSTNVILVAFGEEKVLADWADDKRCTISYKTLWRRIRDGWIPEVAISAPRDPRGHYIRETD